jgi:hypothetical protein
LKKGEYANCNYCVNHWGIDLCACGSGEHYTKCNEALRLLNTKVGEVEDSQPTQTEYEETSF